MYDPNLPAGFNCDGEYTAGLPGGYITDEEDE